MFDKTMLAALAAAVFFGCTAVFSGFAGENAAPTREMADQLMKDGNFREAADMYQRLLFDSPLTAKDAVPLLANAWTSLARMGGAETEIASLYDRAVAVWPDSWRMAQLAARVELTGHRPGFVRPLWQSGQPRIQLFPIFRDDGERTRLISHLLRGEKSLDDSADPASVDEKVEYYQLFGGIILQNRGDAHAWRLTALTDLDAEDDADAPPVWSYPRRGAPVDVNGSPLYFRTPSSWDAAENDGERWRWVLARLAELGNAGKTTADLLLGEFLLRQFGVHTMVADAPLPRNADIAGETGPYAVRTLAENETISRLATGLKRFAMPEEFDFIAILRRIAEDDGVPELQLEACTELAGEFENRQQYDKALELWRAASEIRPESGWKDMNGARNRVAFAVDGIARITGRNGLLEYGPVAPAGRTTVLSYLYRNGDQVAFTARRLDEKRLLQDIRALVKSGSEEVVRDYVYQAPAMLGRWVVEKDLDKYVVETAAEWSRDLEPLSGYRSQRVSVELPVSKPGCYLVEATMRDGNTSRMVLWIADLALVKKTIGERQLLYVADAVSGEPAAGATVSFLGYSTRYDKRKIHIENVRDFAEKTDANGLVDMRDVDMNQKAWLIAAETDDGRLAYLGFDHVWFSGHSSEAPETVAAFFLTDRPVYRPGQDVNLKLWLGRGSYAQAPAEMAGKSVQLRIHNPMGDVVLDKRYSTDAYGGAADVFALGKDAVLGQYSVGITGERGQYIGGGWFSLEEYKKPEFEVSLDTPSEALTLGDSVQLKVRANYYYGAPVANGKVSYKVVRTTHRQSWTPPWRWDWLYGAGAAYREFSGGPASVMPWNYEQPEIVADGEGTLDPDGVFRITLDTAPAKELFADRDHNYQVTVEVTDQSRRTIVGSGQVVASREPFSVKVWAHQGYYRAGQEARANIKALLPMGAGVKAQGRATLFRVTYDATGAPSEQEVAARDIVTDGDGNAETRLTVDNAGQYRLSCRLVDAKGNAVQGGTSLTVRGETGDADFRFTALELVAERREYKHGDTVRLAINSENKSGVVLLFPRVERREYASQPPRVLRLENGSAEIELDAGRADQPNFFCEAITIYEGKFYSETCEIFVPPADKALTVEVASDKDSYLPGEKANFTVTVADAVGNPVAGQCVVSVYDKSVEYIAGGSNVGDIRAFFWSGKRYFSSMQQSSFRDPYSVSKQGDRFWQPIGVFGEQEADWNDDSVYTNGKIQTPARIRQAGGRGNVTSRARYQGQAIVATEADMVLNESAPVLAGFAAAPPAPAPMEAEMAVDAKMVSAPMSGGGAAMAEAAVRSEFADTALWIAALETDADGKASFSVDMPENLTAWKARTWVMGTETRVGDGERQVETKKNVIVRPQAPRFLTQKDQVILSANLHNYLPRGKTARAELILEGGMLEAADGVEPVRTVELAANGEARVDWLVNAKRPGEAKVVMKLLTDEESDAAEIIVPVIVHGSRRVENFGGVLRGEETEQIIRFTVPAERLPDQSALQLSFSPSIASSMLEALPFLIEYPYGCTEQTLNRFLPVVTARSYLERMGVSLADAKAMLDKAAKDGTSEEWKKRFGDPRAALRSSPVFDDKELAAMVKSGVERLTGMQNADGGWGWFSGSGERSWPHTTAVVVHGLAAARDRGAAISMGVLDEGVAWLTAYQAKEVERLKMTPDETRRDPGVYRSDDEKLSPKKKADNLDAFVYMILAERGKADPGMRDFLYRDRLDLSLTGLSMFGLAMQREGRAEELSMIVRNLAQYLETSPDNNTAWLRTPPSGWWWWYNDSVETQAWYLKLLSRVEPKSAAAAGVAKYLLQNRKNGSYWRSTRDTAYAIDALAEYAAASGESEPDMTVTLYLDGKQVVQRRLDKTNILADNRLTLAGLAVETGEHELRIVRSGTGNLYFAGSLDVFSLEDPIPAAGGDLKVTRTYHRLVPEEAGADMRSAAGVAVKGRVEKYRREEIPGPFASSAPVSLASGDLVEVTLDIEAANDYEYLVFEDMKAAGLEAVELRSGYGGNSLGAYIEYRDQKVVLFVRSLPQGKYTIGYRFRAEVPGSFSALPVFGGGMYATDLFCNSDEMKVKITEPGVFE